MNNENEQNSFLVNQKYQHFRTNLHEGFRVLMKIEAMTYNKDLL